MSTHTAVATTAKGKLEVVTLPTPTPEPGEVLIRVRYTALIPPDTYQLDSGFLLSEDSYPYVLGFAASGEIAAVGEGVTDLKEGDRVVSFNFPLTKNKALQEYTVVARTLVAKIPDDLPLHTAAAIPDNYVCAMFTIFGAPNLAIAISTSFPDQSLPPKPDIPVLVYGAGSSSGQYMIQLFKLAGYTTIIATASSSNHPWLKELGASHCFDYRSPDLTKDILSITGGKPVPIIVDCIAAKTTLRAISTVGGEGTRLALLMPVKDGDTVTNSPDSALHFGVPPWAKELIGKMDVIEVYTFRHQQDDFARENFLPKILPRLLEKKALQANPVRLIKNGSLKERVEEGLDLLRRNKISGEKVVIELDV